MRKAPPLLPCNLANTRDVIKWKSSAIKSIRSFPSGQQHHLWVLVLGVRAGTEHRYTGVWLVVVEGRVCVRSWNDKPTGWYRAFLAQPLGSIRLADREIAIRARRLRGERLRNAVTRAYAEKYNTKGSEKWVRGFAERQRSANTLELVPVQPSVRRRIR